MLNRLIDNRYEILKALRTTEYSRLHYGWDHHLQRPVAVKEILAEKISDARVIEGLLADASCLLPVSHPNVVGVHDLRQDSAGRVFAILEFVDGLSVEALLSRLAERSKRLPVALALSIVRQSLAAVACVHSRARSEPQRSTALGIRPSKIVLAAGGSVKLIGFGLSNVQYRLPNKDLLTLPHNRARYLSPEEVRSEPADSRADVFTLGLILYELVVGRSPYDGLSTGDLLRQIANAELEYGPLFSAGAPKAVARLMKRALTAQPQSRYPTAAAMLEDVRRAAASLAAADPAAQLANLLEALESPDESKTRRALLMTRGGDPTRMESVETTAVAPSRFTQQPDREYPRRPAETARDFAAASAAEDLPAPDKTARQHGERFRRRRVVATWLLIACIIAYTIADLYWGFGPLARLAGVHPRGLIHAGTASPVEVITVPAGAELLVGGAYTGHTPCKLSDITPGPAAIRLRLPGFLPIDTVLTIPEGDTPLDLKPFVFSCRIHFNSIPAGARVLINGRELSDLEAARFSLAVTETVQVEMRLSGEMPLPAASFNPLVGVIPPSDTARWRWLAQTEQKPAELAGVFSKIVEIRSRPPRATVHLNGDSIPVGHTNLTIRLPYGDHMVRLSREPFMDYRFAITVGRETPSSYSPVLRRTVHLRAVERTSPEKDIGARIEWIREGPAYLKTPFDNLKTPYSIQLGGVEHEMRFSHRLFADTTVQLDPETDQLTITMRRISNSEEKRAGDRVDNDAREGWVQFQVRGRDGPIAEAEVIGVDKDSGVVVRYGLTDAAGQLTTRVPIGDYEWRAVKHGYEGRVNGERIRGGKGLKKITLKAIQR